MITIGIDPHKATVTAVALDATGRILGTAKLRVTTALIEQLLVFARNWPQRQWAVEGAAGLGLGVAQQLTAGAEVVFDVPAKLASRARLLANGHGRKTDALDAFSVATVAQGSRKLRLVKAEDPTVVLRLLSDHRDDLVCERTRALNRLHRLLRELIPGGGKRQLSTLQAAALLRTVRPGTGANTCRKELARDLLDGLRRLDTRIRALTKEITEAVALAGTGLTGVHPCGWTRVTLPGRQGVVLRSRTGLG